MKGVSALVAVVLILLIAVALAAMAYLWFTGVFMQVGSTSGEQIDEVSDEVTTVGHITIDSVSGNKIYIRNDGNVDLTEFAIFIENNPVEADVPSLLRVDETAVIEVNQYFSGKDNLQLKVASAETYITKVVDMVMCKGDDVLLCMTFDEGIGKTVTDSGKYGNSGSLKGDPEWVLGISGYALEFDDSYVEVFDDASLDTDNFTISMWIKPKKSLSSAVYGSDNNAGLINHGTGDNPSFDLRFSGMVTDTVTLDIEIGEDGTSTKSTASLGSQTWDKDEWYHVVATHGDGLNIYLNGILVKTDTGFDTVDSSSSNLIIGSRGDEGFKGVIDEVRLINRTMEAGEVLVEYQQFVKNLS